jgi:hypothetical protein
MRDGGCFIDGGTYREVIIGLNSVTFMANDGRGWTRNLAAADVAARLRRCACHYLSEVA